MRTQLILTAMIALLTLVVLAPGAQARDCGGTVDVSCEEPWHVDPDQSYLCVVYVDTHTGRNVLNLQYVGCFHV